MSLLPIRPLISGLDTVHAAYYLRPGYGAAFSYEALLQEKERLRSDRMRDGKAVAIGDWTFALQPYGSGSGYPLVLKNAEYTIECGENNTPGFFVAFRSEALWQRGARAMHERLLTWAESVGLVPVKAESLSRVDFAFDYFLPTVDFTDENVVSLSAKDSRHRQDRKIQTMSFGRGDVLLRIYNKVDEIAQQSDKVWFFDLWGETENIWRIEWQIRKDMLRRFGLRTFADLFAGQGDLLRYLASEHDTLRVPTDDSNRSRWPLHPLWSDLLRQIEALDSQGVYRDIDPQAALNERLLRMAISVYGYLKRIAAITGMQHAEDFVSLATAQERLEQLVYRVHNAGSWKLDVQTKREQMELGNWS